MEKGLSWFTRTSSIEWSRNAATGTHKMVVRNEYRQQVWIGTRGVNRDIGQNASQSERHILTLCPINHGCPYPPKLTVLQIHRVDENYPNFPNCHPKKIFGKNVNWICRICAILIWKSLIYGQCDDEKGTSQPSVPPTPLRANLRHKA